MRFARRRPARSPCAEGDEPIDARLPSGLESPALARRAIAEGLGNVLARDALESVQLLVSELVTNSVQHAGLGPDDPIELRANAVHGMVRVEVVDPGPGFEHSTMPTDDSAESGRGLQLVEKISDCWGVSSGPTTVWFELGSEESP